MPATPAQRRAAAVFRARRQAAGYVRVDVLLAPDVITRLNQAVPVYGSQAGAISAALALLPTPPDGETR